MIKDNKRTKGQEVNYKDDNNPANELQLRSRCSQYFQPFSCDVVMIIIVSTITFQMSDVYHR